MVSVPYFGASSGSLPHGSGKPALRVLGDGPTSLAVETVLPLCPFGDRRRDGRRLILGGEMSCGTALFNLEICDIRSAPRDIVRSDHEKFCGAAEGEKKFGYVGAFCEPIAVRRHTCIHVTGSSFDGEGSWPLEKGSATLS